MRKGNKYRISGDAVEMILPTGTVIRVSKQSLQLVSPYTWCQEGTGYIMSRTFGKPVKLHRLILGAQGKQYVDHIDGDPLNNTLENQRICTKQQNEFNQKLRVDNRSGYRGVSFHKQSGRYRASITRDGRQISIGLFVSAEKAAEAYNQKASELFGEFARLNRTLGGLA